MRTLVVSASEVHELLTMRECIELMEETLISLARGEGVQPLRSLLPVPGQTSALGVMPGMAGGAHPALGIKVISIFPRNPGSGLDSHQGAVLLFDLENGSLRAVLEAGAVTAVRTAAVSGVATRALARQGAGDLAVLGSGVQARTHFEAMAEVCALQRARVWSRTREHAARLALALAGHPGLPPVEVCTTAEDAVCGADVICTVTAAEHPVLQGSWLAPGAHVNAVGSCTPVTRELDAAAMARARVFVDRRESALHEAGNLLLAVQEGAVTEDAILGELGDVLRGAVPGRRSREDVTLFQSLGVAVEDVACAEFISRKAVERGLGTFLDLALR